MCEFSTKITIIDSSPSVCLSEAFSNEVSTWMGDRCEVPVTAIANSFFFKLGFIFSFAWPLKAIFLFSFYVKTAE